MSTSPAVVSSCTLTPADAAPSAPSADHLLPLVYDELRRLAARFFRRETAGHTLQPTALVHEAYCHLAPQMRARWQSREHFIAVAAQAMRRILVNHAQRRQAAKRGGCWRRVSLDATDLQGEPRVLDLLALDEALTRLETLDARQARVVEMRFFAGLSVEETARVLDVSPRTVEIDWRMARAWLFNVLQA